MCNGSNSEDCDVQFCRLYKMINHARGQSHTFTTWKRISGGVQNQPMGVPWVSNVLYRCSERKCKTHSPAENVLEGHRAARGSVHVYEQWLLEACWSETEVAEYDASDSPTSEE